MWNTLRSRLAPLVLPAVVLTAVVALLYWPVARFGFLNWDDPWYVTNNPMVKSWSPSNLLAIATEPKSKNFAPLTIFTLLVEHTLFGLNAGGYHVVNAMLHAANSLLVLLLVRQVTQSRWIAWFTALLFAVHPIQIETVAWISSLKSLLAAFFMLASLICWLRPERTARQEGFGLLWLVLALMAKASAVVTPAIVVAWEFLVLRRRLAESLPRQIIPGLFCLMGMFLNMHAQNQLWGGTRDHYEWGLPRILAVDSVLLWVYLRKLAAPYDLSVLYDITGENPWGPALWATSAWVLVGIAVWRTRHSHPLILWGCVTVLLLMFPVLNFFPITTVMNDRYLYLPCVLVFAGAAGAIQALAARLAWTPESEAALAQGGLEAKWAMRRRRVVGSVVAGLLMLATGTYASVTQRYLEVWRTPESLWSHARRHAPEMPIVRIQWALTLRDLGRTEEACAELRSLLASDRADDLDRERAKSLLQEWCAEAVVPSDRVS